jgi:peptide/nickel transport system substrate-binding protein
MHTSSYPPSCVPAVPAAPSHLLRWLLVAALLAVLAGCATPPEAVRRIVYGLTLQPSGFDPHIHASSELGIPLRSVYDTLVYRDPDTGAFIPGLAESWEISADERTYTFRLKTGVVFHDGTAFDAAAVGANLDRITAPETASQRAAFMLGPYEGYDVIDAHTVRIRLSAPYAPLLDSLSQVYLGMASPVAFSQYTPETYQFHQIGTGPFRFSEYIPGDRLVLRRNPAYTWGPAFYGPAPASSVDEIEFRFFTDPAGRALALESGDAQVMGELPPLDARALSSDPTLSIVPVPIAGQPLQFLMNTRIFPTDDVRMRRALLYGTNRESIADVVFGQFSPVAWSALSAPTQFYDGSLQGSYLYDLSGAQSLLSEAGFEDTNNDGLRDVSGADITLRVLVPPWGLIPEVSQLLADGWRQLGIATELVTVPTRSALFEAIDAGDYHLVAWYEFGRDPAFLSRYFTSTGVNAWTGFASPDLDTLLTQAETSLDPVARGALYAQAQRIILDQALILPIREYVNLNGARGVTGLRYDAYGWFPLLWDLALAG